MYNHFYSILTFFITQTENLYFVLYCRCYLRQLHVVIRQISDQFQKVKKVNERQWNFKSNFILIEVAKTNNKFPSLGSFGNHQKT